MLGNALSWYNVYTLGCFIILSVIAGGSGYGYVMRKPTQTDTLRHRDQCSHSSWNGRVVEMLGHRDMLMGTETYGHIPYRSLKCGSAHNGWHLPLVHTRLVILTQFELTDEKCLRILTCTQQQNMDTHWTTQVMITQMQRYVDSF